MSLCNGMGGNLAVRLHITVVVSDNFPLGKLFVPRICYTFCPISNKNSGAKSAPFFHSTVL